MLAKLWSLSKRSATVGASNTAGKSTLVDENNSDSAPLKFREVVVEGRNSLAMATADLWERILPGSPLSAPSADALHGKASAIL